MTKAKAKAAPAQKLLTKTIKLITPVYAGDEKITAVTLTEPLFHQQVAAHKEAVAKEISFFEVFVPMVSNLPRDAACSLKLRDAGKIQKWFKSINDDAVRGAGLSVQNPGDEEDTDPFAMGSVSTDAGPASGPDDMLAGEREFTLLVPVVINGRTVTKMTAREPDLGASMKAAKFKGDYERTAALLSAITGEDLPVIGRMAVRDTEVMEAWMAPFARDLLMAAGG